MQANFHTWLLPSILDIWSARYQMAIWFKNFQWLSIWDCAVSGSNLTVRRLHVLICIKSYFMGPLRRFKLCKYELSYLGGAESITRLPRVSRIAQVCDWIFHLLLANSVAWYSSQQSGTRKVASLIIPKPADEKRTDVLQNSPSGLESGLEQGELP
jgi:hypothetical protein